MVSGCSATTTGIGRPDRHAAGAETAAVDAVVVAVGERALLQHSLMGLRVLGEDDHVGVEFGEVGGDTIDVRFVVRVEQVERRDPQSDCVVGHGGLTAREHDRQCEHQSTDSDRGCGQRHPGASRDERDDGERAPSAASDTASVTAGSRSFEIRATQVPG